MKLTPDELRRAYARATSAGAGAHPEADLLARLLAGDVTDEERRSAVAHLATCARCSEEVRVARPVGDAFAKVGVRVARPAAWWRPAILLAAAAAVLVAGGLALRPGRGPAPAGGPYRSAAGPGLRSLLPEGSRLSRNAPLLRWTGAAPGTSFDVVLANERLDVLARIPGVKDAQLLVPASVLAALPPGSKLVWKVTVVLPDGSRPEAATFVSVLE